MQKVTGVVDSICTKLKSQDNVDSVIQDDFLGSKENHTQVNDLSSFSIKNTRRSLEDRMVILPNAHEIFGVFNSLLFNLDFYNRSYKT